MRCAQFMGDTHGFGAANAYRCAACAANRPVQALRIGEGDKRPARVVRANLLLESIQPRRQGARHGMRLWFVAVVTRGHRAVRRGLCLLEHVTHAQRFGLQVGAIVVVHVNNDGQALLNAHAQYTQVLNLCRIVGQQLNRANLKVLENGRSRPVLALVCLMAQQDVCLNGVIAFILQVVGLQLVLKANPASLLAQVDHDSAAGFGNVGHGIVKLVAAVAAARSQHVACEAFGVDAHGHALAPGHITEHKRKMLLVVARVGEVTELKLTLDGRNASTDSARELDIIGN